MKALRKKAAPELDMNDDQNNSKDDEIDYLHPYGKPAVTDGQKYRDQEECEKPVSKNSLDEADGHHMCNERCRHKQKLS